MLMEAVLGTGDVTQMPPEDEGAPLTAEQISLLKRWIDQGAQAADEEIPPDPRAHWAYQPPVAVAVPTGSAVPDGSNPIDAFLASIREREGVVAVPRASKEVQLRRLYFDLLGLPPSPEELQAFLSDPAEDAYEKVVDRLLQSPRYGERWGRHWMDVWRYTDWSGLDNKMRHSQKHIWRWRDWIIESLNEDKGYDRMVQEMLAGDELDPTSSDTLRATGFLARNWYLYNRNVWLDDVVEHTSKGFLGITFNCARCHEHKYDPLSHENYYQFRAFFETHNVRLDQVGTETDLEKDGLPRVYDADLEAVTYLFVRGEETRPDKEHPHGPGVPEVLGTIDGMIEPVTLPVDAYVPGLKSNVRQSMIADAHTAVDRAVQELTDKQQELETAISEASGASSDVASDSSPTAADDDVEQTKKVTPAEANRAVVVARHNIAVAKADLTALQAAFRADAARYLGQIESESQLSELTAEAGRTHHEAALRKAERSLSMARQRLQVAQESASSKDPDKAQAAITSAGEQVDAATKELQLLREQTAEESTEDVHAAPVYPSTSSGRRLALARWITSDSNPLASRVAVNHIWNRHFGSPLVESTFDFGLRSRKPIHLQLLDWLALDLMGHSWSMKHLHRQIVTSEAYRMQSSPSQDSEGNIQVDPDNHLYWRMNARRMEAELVRDTLIYLTGELDLTMGGADLPIPEEDDGTRRTIYYRYSRDFHLPILKVFNPASVEECYERQHSIIPQQALAMSNSRLALKRGRELAAVISRDTDALKADSADKAFTVSAFERILNRSPVDAECDACEQTLEELMTAAAKQGMTEDAARQRARENLVQVLLNHNDFITIR